MKVDATKIAAIYLMLEGETDSIIVEVNPHKGFEPVPLYEYDLAEWISAKDEELALATDTMVEVACRRRGAAASGARVPEVRAVLVMASITGLIESA